MSWLEFTITGLTLVPTYFNVIATIGLYRADDLNRFQKIAQGTIVWTIPLLGAWLILFLLRANNPKSVPFRMLGYHEQGWFAMANSSHAGWEGVQAHHSHHGSGHVGHHSGGGDIGGSGGSL